MRLKLFVIFLFCLGSVSSQPTKNLNFYLDQGRANSPLLKDYINQYEANRIDSLKIRASQKPLINLFSNILYSPQLNNRGYDEAITNGGQYAGGINVSKPILNRHKRNAEYESVTIQGYLIRNESKISKRDLEKEITDQYIQTYLNYLQVSFGSKIIETLTNETNLLKELFKKGLGKQTDYMSVSIELQTEEIAFEDQKNQFRTGLLLLNSICGISDTSSVTLAPPDIEQKLNTDISRSPGFYKFTLDSLSLQNQRRLVDARYRPQINIFGDAGVNSSHIQNLYNYTGFSAGLSLLVPLYDGNLRKLDYQKLDISNLSVKAYQQHFYKTFSLQLAQIAEQIKTNDNIILRLQQQLKDIELLLRLNRQQLANGLIQTVEYVVHLRSYLEVNNELNKAVVKKQLLINQNNYWTW